MVAPGRRFDRYEADVAVGFGHTPMPGDYRPAGAIEGLGRSRPAPGDARWLAGLAACPTGRGTRSYYRQAP
jgi:hypothetical protein